MTRYYLRHGWGTQISGDGEDEFAEVGGGFHFSEGFAGFGPRAAFEDGAQLCGGDCFVHVFEVLPRADVDSLDVDLLVQDHGERDWLGGAREHADLCDDAAHLYSAQGTRKRADAAHFDDEIHAFSVCLFHDPAVPLRGFAIVETLVETEGTGALKLGVAGGNAKGTHALDPGELQGEDGDAAGALDGDG